MVMDFAIRIVFYLIPMYFANSSAMVLGGKTPIDFGAKWGDGRPVFGRGKTFKGLFAGVAMGTIAALAASALFPAETGLLSGQYLLLGFLLALGAILGDMAGSFVKRRMGMEQGKPAFFLDQLDFVAGGAILSLPVYSPSPAELAIIIITTLIVHRLSNYIAYKAKLKKVPW